mmetsp:Transcript_30510/g.29145  ORF Transcript_30510/g.29145 Transcript_30510/m.29145 type:complete len:262 (-) Transcript_30510:91-876(-)
MEFSYLIRAFLLISFIGIGTGFRIMQIKSSINHYRSSYQSTLLYTSKSQNIEEKSEIDIINDFKKEKEKENKKIDNKNEKLYVSDVVLTDLLNIISLANNQFLVPPNDKLPDVINLDLQILKLFLPKLIFPKDMAHSVIGMRSAQSNQLQGFVDLSVQTTSGSLAALDPKTLSQRKKIYGERNLEPYLCNLFISPSYRKRGLAKQLIMACEQRSIEWGYRKLNLHCETKEIPALSLYLKNRFEIMNTVDEKKEILWMSKKL